MSLLVSPHWPIVLADEVADRYRMTRIWHSTNKTYWVVEYHHRDAWFVNAMRWIAGTLDYQSIYFAAGDRNRQPCFASAMYCARRACVRNAESRSLDSGNGRCAGNESGTKEV